LKEKMNTMKVIFGLVLFFFCSIYLSAQVHQEGDFLRGGVIFHINETQDTALICAIRDQAQYVDWASAKQLCERFFSIQDGQMYRGWRMPSKAEIVKMKEKRDMINAASEKNGGEGFDPGFGAHYWSGTEEGTHAWLQPFTFGLLTLMHKDSNTFFVRGVQKVALK